ncbi:nSTAND1 domain-containing NTPase [Streptomyces cinnamoneus]|uniref:nSTAND1 domain-containing NTPase n=1 Tax=Streptomyces cinnamoneus TaxID=53446 RepID=UPI0037B9FD46
MDADDRLLAGLVRVTDARGTTVGTGFVARRGLVLTCAHVVTMAGAGPGAAVGLVRHTDGAQWRGTVRTDPWGGAEDGDDVAVVDVPDAPEEARLPLGTTASAARRRFATYGYPKGRPVDGTPGECLLLPTPTTDNGFRVFQIESRQVTYGFSGAPVWDGETEAVVGMVKSVYGVRDVVAGPGDKGRFTVPADRAGRLTDTAYMIPVEELRQRCPDLRFGEDDRPYRGLEFFDDPRFYFGREAVTHKLIETLTGRGIAVLVGTSGSGKSSLLRAGLAKGLDGLTTDLASRARPVVVPGSEPHGVLARELLRSLPEDSVRAFAKALKTPGAPAEGPDAHETFGRALRDLPPATAAAVIARTVPGGPLLLVDQFERLYAHCREPEVRDHFVDTLLALPGEEAAVVLALRADFYDQALRHPGLSRVLAHSQVTVQPMTREELRQAIVEPARLVTRDVQDGLVDRLISDVLGRKGGLPLLELTLEQLWEAEAGRGVLTVAGYEALDAGRPKGTASRGGVAGAVGRVAKRAWEALTAEEQKAAPALFMRLVAAEHGDAGGLLPAQALIARRAWLAELDDVGRSVVAKFVAERLLVLRGDPVSGQPAVEIAHEILLETWERLARWVLTHGSFARWYGKDFAPAFQLWHDHDRHDDFLLPESMIPEARRWLRDYPPGLAGPARDYIHRSAERADRARENDWRARRTAEESRSVLWATRAVRQDDPTKALALALAAGRLEHPSATALQTLADIAYRPGLRHELRFGHTGPVRAVARRAGVVVTGSADRDLIVWDAAAGRVRRTLRAHSGLVHGVDLTDDGRTAVSASADRTVVLWDTTTGHVRDRFEGHQDAVLGVAVSGDGRWVVSASADGTAVVWDVRARREKHRLAAHRDVVAGVALSRDGRTTATCSSDGTVLLWNTATGEQRHTLAGHDGPVWTVALDRHGGRVASGSADRGVILWDAGTGRELARPAMGHTATVWGVALTPDGERVVSGSADHTVAVWDRVRGRLVRRFGVGDAVGAVALDDGDDVVFCVGDRQRLTAWRTTTGENVLDLGAHGEPVTALALSRDARAGLVGCGNGDLLVWDVHDRRPVRLGGHPEDPVVSVAVSWDGRTALSLSEAGVLMRWDLGPVPGGTRAHPGVVVDAALSGDGLSCVVATAEGEALVGPEWRRLYRGRVTSVAVDGRGRTPVVGCSDGSVIRWGEAGRNRRRTPRHTGAVRAVAVGDDGRTVVSVDDGGELFLWLPGVQEPLRPLAGTDLSVSDVALDHDGDLALVRTTEGEAMTLDLNSREVHTLGGPAFRVDRAALSADGRHVLTSTPRHDLGLWDARCGDLLRVLPSRGLGARALAVSGDGRLALCAAEGGLLSLWDTDTCELREEWSHDEVNALALSADGTRAVIASDVLSLAVVRTTGTGERSWLSGHSEAVRGVALTPDGRTAVSGSVDHTAILWDVTDGEFVRRFTGHNAPVDAVALSADGRRVVSGSRDASVIAWSAETGEVLHRFGHEAPVRGVALSPDGTTAVAGTADGTVSVCRLTDGGRSVLVGHAVAVRSVAFSPDGRFVLSGDDDGTTHVWDLPTGQTVRILPGSGSPVVGLACSADADGMVAITATADGDVRVRRLHTPAELVAWARANRQVHRFTCAERSALLIEPGCDPLGNPPPDEPVATPVPLTRATLGAVPVSAPPSPPARELHVGVRTFDAVQHGRRRRWRLRGPLGRVTLDIVAEGIDLDPQITLYAPDGATSAVGEPQPGQRSRIGPLDLGAEGDYTVVAEGRRDGLCGGYTLLLDEVT